jgi:hypothetical protein
LQLKIFKRSFTKVATTPLHAKVYDKHETLTLPLGLSNLIFGSFVEHSSQENSSPENSSPGDSSPEDSSLEKKTSPEADNSSPG